MGICNSDNPLPTTSRTSYCTVPVSLKKIPRTDDLLYQCGERECGIEKFRTYEELRNHQKTHHNGHHHKNSNFISSKLSWPKYSSYSHTYIKNNSTTQDSN